MTNLSMKAANKYRVDAASATMDAWQSELLTQRIRDLNDAKMRAFTDPHGMYWGAPPLVLELIHRAIHHLEADQLPQAERVCRVTERLIIRERRRFAATHG